MPGSRIVEARNINKMKPILNVKGEDMLKGRGVHGSQKHILSIHLFKD
jgi:hypothetical protein